MKSQGYNDERPGTKQQLHKFFVYFQICTLLYKDFSINIVWWFCSLDIFIIYLKQYIKTDACWECLIHKSMSLYRYGFQTITAEDQVTLTTDCV
jgi:hypothetical protein